MRTLWPNSTRTSSSSTPNWRRCECGQWPGLVCRFKQHLTRFALCAFIFRTSPDTASFVQKVEREREARDRGEVKDNRSFIGKYWMYIVPVVILALLSGGGAADAPAAR